MIILFKESDIIPILKGTKDITTRENKGQYKNLKIGQTVKFKANYSRPYFAKATIINIEYKTLKELKAQDIHRIGFKTKKEYLKQDYNQEIKENEKKIIITFKITKNNILAYLK